MLWPVQGAVVLRHALLATWPFLAAVAVGGLVVAAVLLLRRLAGRRRRAEHVARLRLTLAEIDVLTDRQFELALRDLMVRDGCTARQVGQQGDQAADIIAEDPRRSRIVLQARTPGLAPRSCTRSRGLQVPFTVPGSRAW